jgi:MtrB/PioB family decaheme-associated outer membrane protein
MVAGLAALAAASPARADVDGFFTAGTMWWAQSANEATFQEFREVPQGTFLESFLFRQWNGPLALVISGQNAMRADQKYDVTFAKGAKVRIDAGYQQIPHLYSQVARIGYYESSPGTFVLPDSLQLRNQRNPSQYNANMNDYLNQSADDARLSMGTNIATARLRARPQRGWQFDVTAVRRNRDGRKAYGGTFGFSNAVEMVEPINERMLDVDGLANWTGKNVNVRAGVGVSSFDNRVNTLVWDNPKQLTDTPTTPGRGRLDLYPNNDAFRGRLGMSWQLKSKTSLDVEATASRQSQNAAWLPFTINTAIPQSSPDSLPGRNTDAKAVEWTGDVRLHSHALTQSVTTTLRFHHRTYDNNTPAWTFSGRSAYDNAWTPGPFTTNPFGNSQSTAGADVDWQAIRHMTVSGTAEMRYREHTLREGTKDEEPFFQLQTRAYPTDAITMRAYASYGHRYLTEFEVADLVDTGEQPGLRRYDIANREQGRAGAEVDATLTDDFDVAFQYDFERNLYDQTTYGLQEDRTQGGLVQGTLHASDGLDLSAGYGVAWPITRQASNESNASPPPTADYATNWWAYIHDRSEWATAGANWWAMPKKLNFTLNYTYSRDETQYDLFNAAGTGQDVPSTFYRRHIVEADAIWRAKYHTDISLRYGYDFFDVVDFANQSIPLLGPTATAGTAIYLGDNVRPYVANMISVVYSRRF